MSRILYSKYSNERSASFQIRTDIMEEDGKRIVCKSAATEESKPHILRVYDFGKKLNKAYENTLFSANSCQLKDEKLYFEYVEGQTFEEHLDKFLKDEDYTSIISEVQKFFDEVKKTLELKTFQPTEQFKNVFGDIAFPVTLQAGSLNNIDYIFSNVFMQAQQWTIIDYEWTFDFPIPFLYVVYRAVHYYTYDRTREKLKKIGLLRILGITEELEQCFQLMEHRFQLYILGETTPVINMYRDIAGEAYDFNTVVSRERKRVKQNVFQVYYDYGNGFHEADSCFVKPVEADEESGIIRYEIEASGAKMLRIDPGEESCIVSQVKLLCNGADIQNPVFHTNGMNAGENCYVFSTKDPMLMIPNLPQGVQKVEFICKLEVLEAETAATLIKGLKGGQIEPVKENLDVIVQAFKEQYEEKKTVLENELEYYKTHYHAAMGQREALNRENAHLQHLLAESNAEYNRVMHSASMKLTKPIRFIKKVIKKIVKSNKFTYKFARGLKCLKENGFRYTWGRFKAKVRKKMEPKTGYWRISPAEIKRQKETVFTKDITFSIIVPLYNTPEKFLCEMIESVQGQTYGKWELCLADGSDAAHSYVEKICKRYAKKDKRILYCKLEKNEGISENTNRCLEMATGDYIALFDHDDLLFPSALYENMCVIEEQDADFIYSDEDTFSTTPLEAYCPHHKPDFSPDTLRSYNYICHLSVFKHSLLKQVGKFRKEFDGSQDYDMILRLTEKAEKVVHIPKIIYYWRAHAASVASDISAKTYCMDAAKKALDEHLDRLGLKGEAVDTEIPSVYKINYEIKDNPLISILIPTKDYIEDLALCINSIMDKSTYRNFEIIVIENNSERPETFEYYKELEKNPQIKVVYWESEFNYSAINNFGFKYATGDYILLLNNDLEIITPNWLEEMLMFAQREDVGAVGAKLYYPDDTIQHAGVIYGLGGVAGHSHKYFPRDHVGYSYRLKLAQNLSCVTAACLLTKREVFEKINGLDETFKVAFNDVDFCMRIRKAGYLVVFTPFTEIYHYESKSRGQEDTPEKIKRFQGEIERFKARWGKELESGDPYYNVNLTLDREDFSLK